MQHKAAMATDLRPGRGVMYFDCCINETARSRVIRFLLICPSSNLNTR